MNRQSHENEWARQVPERRFWSPYRDYGWEPRQSVLPEFRDPTLHFMPDERDRLERWQRFRERNIVSPANPSGRRRAARPGIHTGKGPRNYKRSDDRLYEEICEQMTQNGWLDASSIEVKVKDGEVTLSGHVPNRRTKRLAEDISDSVMGVRDVHNRLRLPERETAERWIDEVGGSGVYPASDLDDAPRDAEAQGMASWGQGERGAEGYDDHGDSELHLEP